MSNTHAIAAVTSTLRFVLQQAIDGEPDPVAGRKVTTLRPAQVAALGSDDTPARGLNLFLYQVTPNQAWNLTDLPTRNSSGALVRRPVAALDLHYLVTAYGDEPALEPQRLLARAALALAAYMPHPRQWSRRRIAWALIVASVLVLFFWRLSVVLSGAEPRLQQIEVNGPD